MNQGRRTVGGGYSAPGQPTPQIRGRIPLDPWVFRALRAARHIPEAKYGPAPDGRFLADALCTAARTLYLVCAVPGPVDANVEKSLSEFDGDPDGAVDRVLRPLRAEPKTPKAAPGRRP